ncbi:MAG: hypothetical protein A2167_01300 [Planctomycetes bacterium RBG_13_46_10]|nr:MAG: hypothetical protein A2167_01300 [Planctomycetes bacterium RBG_13_46_10]
MRMISVVLYMLCSVCVLILTGCEQLNLNAEPQPKANNVSESSFYVNYIPAKLEITPLTEFVGIAGAGQTSEINVYASLLDIFGCQIKSPGVFRFEMYEKVPRSSEPKGRRMAIWPDNDLTDAAQNNKYWRDFLRAYQFNLPFEPASSGNYVLQVTFLCPTGKRLSGEYALKFTK